MTDGPGEGQGGPAEGPGPTPLERIEAAVKDLINEISDEEGPVLLRGAVIAWESMTFNDEGEAMYAANYAATEGTSMASVVGILGLAKQISMDYMRGFNDEID